MPRPTITRVAPTGLATEAFDRVDYADAFEVAIDPALPADPDWWRRKLLVGGPLPMRIAMRVRNALARPFGLTTGEMLHVPVLGHGAGEQVVGLDDAHLDFRLGVAVRDVPGGRRLRLTTTVRFNALAGRLYFAPVRPVHARVVIPGMLRRAAGLGLPVT